MNFEQKFPYMYVKMEKSNIYILSKLFIFLPHVFLVSFPFFLEDYNVWWMSLSLIHIRGDCLDKIGVWERLKMVLDSTLLNTQHYKVQIKGKVEQPRKGVTPTPKHSVLVFCKRNPQVTLDLWWSALITIHICIERERERKKERKKERKR